MTETPVPRTGPSHRHPESIMPLNRRNFLGAAALGAGSLMLGSAQAAPAPALPKFTPPTAKKPMALCFNENPLGLTPTARDAAIAALPDANRYPFVAAERLRKACADFMGGKPENVMLSHGSAESIRASIEAHIRPGVCLICPELTYSDGADTARKNNVKVVTVPMGAKWSVDLEAMKKTVAGINGPVIVYFVNPNNPTSTIVDSKALHDWIRSRPADVFFVIDEAYAEYVRDPSFVSCKTLVDEGLENLCVLKTFSKIFAMAGMRLGFTYAAPAVVNKVRTQVAYDIMLNNSAIAAALVELEDKDFIPNSRKANEDARVIVCKTLDELGIEYLDSQTNFIFMNLKAPLKPFQDRMKAENILVGRPFPPAVEWCRVSLSTPDDMKYFAAKLKEFRRKGWV